MITMSYSVGTVSGDSGVGGLIGSNSGIITSCYCKGEVHGEEHTGGLVGYNDYGDITSSYSSGSVYGNDSVGGLVGLNSPSGTVTSSYSIGSVSGVGSHVGGLVGSGNLASSNFWDVETSGQSSSKGGLGLTTIEMMDSQLYALNGWANDPNWVLNVGRDYPRLSWEGTPGQMIPEPAMDWIEGSGTMEDPYQIVSIAQMMTLRRASLLLDKHFILMNDLDFTSQVFGEAVIPIFIGSFDGNENVIRHLTIQGEDRVALFGALGLDAEVTNLGLEDVDVNGSGDSVGALVGYNVGLISSCYITGTVIGRYTVGGLVGSNSDYGTITSSYSMGSVNGDGGVGGLVGDNDGMITSCYSTGSVSGAESNVGGLVGNNGGSISSSYSTGLVSGTGKYVGGFVGVNHGISTSSFWDTETSGQFGSDGGVGLATTEMQDINTFLDADWDFVGESDNGTEDLWWMPEGDYPRLWWEE